MSGCVARPTTVTLVEQAHRVEDGDQVVVAVLAQRADGQVQVDLGGHPHRDRWRERASTRQPYVRPGGGQSGEVRSRRVARPAAAGRCRPPAAPLGRVRAAGPAGQRRPQRLAALANAASITPKTARAVAGRRLPAVEREQPGVDVGHRPEHRPRHRPGPAGGGEPGQLGARHPVDPVPGPAASRSATSACTMTRPRRSWAARPAGAAPPAPRRCRAGWRRSRSAPGPAGRPRAARSASAVVHGEPVGQRRGPLGDRARQPPGQHRVDLHGVHRARPRGSRASVSEPSPGPTSSTTSSASARRRATMRRTVLASCTKFWPSRLVGRSPSSCGQGPHLGRAEQPRVVHPGQRARRRSRGRPAAASGQRGRPSLREHAGQAP